MFLSCQFWSVILVVRHFCLILCVCVMDEWMDGWMDGWYVMYVMLCYVVLRFVMLLYRNVWHGTVL